MCVQLAPTYEDAARRLRGTLNLGKIDATVETGLAARYEIKGFPSIKFFREGEIRNYNGPRTVDGLVGFGKEMSAPAVVPLHTSEEFQQIEQKHPVSIVFFGGKAGVERVRRHNTYTYIHIERERTSWCWLSLNLVTSACHLLSLFLSLSQRLFDNLAYRLQGSVKFFSVDKSASSIYSTAGVVPDETPLILLVTKHADLSDPLNRYAGPWVEREVREFILKNKLPLINELDQNNFEDVTMSGKKIVYGIINTKVPNETSQQFVESLYRLAKQQVFRDAFVFATLDGIKYHKYVSQFGVVIGEGGSDVTQIPTVVVVDPALDYYYAPEPHSINADQQRIHPIGDDAAIESFLSAILSGKLSLTGTIPWYNPSRYVKLLEKSLSKLPVWQVAVLAVAVMLSIVGGLFYACFSGLDATDEMMAEAAAAAQAAGGAKSKKERRTSAATEDKDENATMAKDEGLRARKGKEH